MEHMPHLTPAHDRPPGTFWVDNLSPDRHTDVMTWTAPGEGSDMAELSPAQIRYLHARLTEILTED